MSEDDGLTPAQREQIAQNQAAIERVVLVDASAVKMRPYKWVWTEHLAEGKFHILAGVPATGKTTLALGIAAAVSCGGTLPDGSRAEPGYVVIWSGEDDIADTIVPRLAAMGAELSRVRIVRAVSTAETRRAFDPARDLSLLQEALRELTDNAERVPIRLLIVDPVVSAVATDSHKNSEVRRSLQPLVDLAEGLRFALLGVTHLTKGTAGREPLERVTGSLAFGALPRVVLFAARQQSEEGEPPKPRLLLRVKSNVGPDGGGFKYDLRQMEVPGQPELMASAVLWAGVVEGDARELLAEAEPQGGDRPAPRRAEAIAFLRTLLQPGPMDAPEIYRRGEEAGFSEDTLKRAKRAAQDSAGRKMFRVSKKPEGGWQWALMF